MARVWKQTLIVAVAACVYAAPAPAQSSECGAGVTVAPGDTLSAIARRCGLTIEAILEANPDIESPDLIAVGQRLALPPTEVAVDAPAGVTGALLEPAGPPPPVLRVDPQSASAGALVALRADNLPPNQNVLIGAVLAGGGYLILERARSDAAGSLDVRVPVPAWAADEDEFVFVVEAPIRGARHKAPPLRMVAAERPVEEELPAQGGAR